MSRKELYDADRWIMAMDEAAPAVSSIYGFKPILTTGKGNNTPFIT
jgi:hypothetical protein